jgi:hypothetical protein
LAHSILPYNSNFSLLSFNVQNITLLFRIIKIRYDVKVNVQIYGRFTKMETAYYSTTSAVSFITNLTVEIICIVLILFLPIINRFQLLFNVTVII